LEPSRQHKTDEFSGQLFGNGSTTFLKSQTARAVQQKLDNAAVRLGDSKMAS
jgi:hypothetical protein